PHVTTTPIKRPPQKLFTTHLQRPRLRQQRASSQSSPTPPSVRNAALAPSTARRRLSAALRGVRAPTAPRPRLVPVRSLPRGHGGACPAALPVVRRTAPADRPEPPVSHLRPPSARLRRCSPRRLASSSPPR